MRTRKIITAMVLAVAMMITMDMVPSTKNAEASTVYLTVEEFAKSLALEIGLKSIPGSESSGYENSGFESSGYVYSLIEKGIIREGDFTAYTKNLTRGDAMVLLNRADEYLYGETLEAELVQTTIEKRIADITKITKAKREDAAKAYLKGFVKGYSNGEYSSNRTLKGTSEITKAGALNCIKMLKNKSLRAKISPDGQLIRTTKLPKYAKYYPYILASFPNEYYDWKFYYEGVTRTRNGKAVELVNLVDYAAPIDVNKITEDGDFAAIRAEREDKWLADARTFITYLLNVDYRTIDKSWIDTMIETNDGYEYNKDMMRTYLEKYLIKMKENKTIVECSDIDMDASSVYYYNYIYYLRVHVKYRVVSSIASLSESVDTLLSSKSHNSILFSTYMVNIRNRTLGKWQDGFYEVKLTSYNGKVSGSFMSYDDASYRGKKVE